MIWLLLVPDSMEKKIKLQVYHKHQLERSGRHEKSANIGVSCLIEKAKLRFMNSHTCLTSPYSTVSRFRDLKKGVERKSKNPRRGHQRTGFITASLQCIKAANSQQFLGKLQAKQYYL